MNDSIKYAGYVIINDSAIWGAGETEAEAWEDSIEWIEGSILDNPNRDGFTAELASAALIAYVNEIGTPNSWGILRGIQCTSAEEADEEFYTVT